MKEIQYQNTIKKTVSLKGKGIHTNKEVTITFNPAPEHTGIVFIRVDIEEKPKIPALASNVSATNRCTTLEKSGVRISTVEHLLAAITGLGIHNIYIEIDGEEVPIIDGSAMPFVEILEQAEIDTQKAPLEIYTVKEIMTFTDEETGSEITLLPSENYEVTTMIDYDREVIGSQYAELKNLSDFKDKIAKARTFSFLDELEKLMAADLIKGGDLKNAVIYVDKELAREKLSKLQKTFNNKTLTITENNVLNNVKLHWENEAARHKLLDVIGDFTLIGMPIKARVIAQKPGHKINIKVAKELQKKIKAAKRNAAPIIDLNKPPLKDIEDIMKILPHRYPFLLIDKVFELTDKTVIAMKNVTMNEGFFQGHFQGAPVMPGVLQIEAMAQCGGILVLSTVPDPENYLTYFMKIDGVKFKQKVVPGDTLVFKADLVTPIRRGICHMLAKGYVSGKMVVEAELMAQIVKVK